MEEGTLLPSNLNHVHSSSKISDNSNHYNPNELNPDKKKKRRKNKNEIRRRSTYKKRLRVKRRKKRRGSFFPKQVSNLEDLFNHPPESPLLYQLRKRMRSNKKKTGKITPRRKKNKRKKFFEVRERRIPYHQYTDKPRFLIITKENPMSKYKSP